MSEGFVIGIDLSLTATGLADYDIDSGRFTNLGTLGSKGKRSDTYAMRGARLQALADDVLKWALAGDTDPRLVVVEGPSYGSQNGSQHDRSGLWWLVVSRLMADKVPVLVVPPRTRAKYATGNGNSGKDIVLAHVIQQYADHTDMRIANDNEADALVLAAMGTRHLGLPHEETLPESNLAAMTGVEAL